MSVPTEPREPQPVNPDVEPNEPNPAGEPADPAGEPVDPNRDDDSGDGES